MKNKTLLIILMASIALGGCYRHCIEFPKEFQQHYFPYSQGQMLTFASSIGDTATLNVSDLTMSKSYKIYWKVKEDCMPTLNVNMQGHVDDIRFELRFMVNYWGQNVYDGEDGTPVNNEPSMWLLSLKYPVLGTKYDCSYFLINTGVLSNTMSNPLDTLSFVCKNTHNEYNPKPLDTLVIVKGKGLVGFRSFNGQKYELVE